MPLPTISLPRDTVDIDGQQIQLRGLSRGEVLSVKTETPAEMEVQLLAFGLDMNSEEVKAWYDATPSSAVQKLVEKVMALSGLDDLGNAPRGA